MRRVVITGLGAVTSIGSNVSAFWAALQEGKSGIKEYYKDPVLRNITPFNLGLVEQFDFKAWKVPHVNNRMNSFLSCATEEALKQSKMNLKDMDPQRVGVCMGSLATGMTKVLEHIEESQKEDYRTVNRLNMLHVLTNMSAALLNVKYGLKGPSLTVSTACASGLSSIIEGMKWIRLGEADVVISGATEDVYNPMYLQSSLRLQAMSSRKYDTPLHASRPFDSQRSGFILGEGSGVLILESLEHALARKAEILAEIIGYGYTSDGYNLVRPETSGYGQRRAMQNAIQMAGVTPREIDHINAHATSTQAGDQIEANAIKSLFQDGPSVSALKSSIGHTFSSAGAIETVAAVLSISNGIALKILNLEKPDVEGVNYCFQTIHKPIRTVLKNSFGFGGINVSAVLRRYE